MLFFFIIIQGDGESSSSSSAKKKKKARVESSVVGEMSNLRAQRKDAIDITVIDQFYHEVSELNTFSKRCACRLYGDIRMHYHHILNFTATETYDKFLESPGYLEWKEHHAG
jgi:hypothetical protein